MSNDIHTTTTTFERRGVLFGFNTDSDGKVTIIIRPVTPPVDGMIEVPFESLKDLVASYVRESMIAALEQADADAILFRAALKRTTNGRKPGRERKCTTTTTSI